MFSYSLFSCCTSCGKIVQHFPREIDFFHFPYMHKTRCQTFSIVYARKRLEHLTVGLKIISSCLRKFFQHFSCHFCSFHYRISSLNFPICSPPHSLFPLVQSDEKICALCAFQFCMEVNEIFLFEKNQQLTASNWKFPSLTLQTYRFHSRVCCLPASFVKLTRVDVVCGGA